MQWLWRKGGRTNYEGGKVVDRIREERKKWMEEG